MEFDLGYADAAEIIKNHGPNMMKAVTEASNNDEIGHTTFPRRVRIR